jgi:hypothetical protein
VKKGSKEKEAMTTGAFILKDTSFNDITFDIDQYPGIPEYVEVEAHLVLSFVKNTPEAFK